MYPEVTNQLDLFSRTCHCDVTVLHQKSLQPVANSVQFVVHRERVHCRMWSVLWKQCVSLPQESIGS